MTLAFKYIKYLLLAILLVITACVEKPQQALRIGAVLWPGYEPLYLAKKLGYFEKQPIKIIDYLSNTDAMQAFRNYNLEAGTFTLDEAFRILADGIDIDIILIMDTSYGGDVILANPDINSVSELKGKPIAVENTAVGAYVLSRALELNNLELEDVQIVSINTMEQISSFATGDVVAAVTFDPNRTQLLKAGKKEIFSSTQIPNEIVDLLVVRKDYLNNNPMIVKHLVQAWYKALNYQRQYPEESASHSLKRFNTSKEEYIKGLELLKFTSRDENLHLLHPDTSPLLQQQEKIIQILKNLKIVGESVSLKDHLNPDFIPK